MTLPAFGASHSFKSQDALSPLESSHGDALLQSSISSSQVTPEGQPSSFLSEAATTAFVRRTLCPTHVGEKGVLIGAVDGLLPPLTSLNEVDLQLYAIIAAILKEFLHSWYGKITLDHTFTEEIVTIIAHCTRALEQRARSIDFSGLLLDEIPEIISSHVTAIRTADELPGASAIVHDSRRAVYHLLRPHPALFPVPVERDSSTLVIQKENEALWRQLLVQGVLAVILPMDDLENGCLRTLVSEILSEMIIGAAISEKVCQPWFLWEAMTRIIEIIVPLSKVQSTQAKNGTIQQDMSASRLEQFGLLSDSKEAQGKGQSHNSAPDQRPSHRSKRKFMLTCWTIIQHIIFGFNAIRTVIVTFAMTSGLSTRSEIQPAASSKLRQTSYSSHASQRLLSTSIWPTIGCLIELDLRMPWLCGVLSLLHRLLEYFAGLEARIDRMLYHQLNTYMHNNKPQQHLPSLLRAVRATIFPSNSLGPSRPAPDEAEIEAIRERCAQTIVNAMPAMIARTYFVTSTSHHGRAGKTTPQDSGEQVSVMVDHNGGGGPDRPGQQYAAVKQVANANVGVSAGTEGATTTTASSAPISDRSYSSPANAVSAEAASSRTEPRQSTHDNTQVAVAEVSAMLEPLLGDAYLNRHLVLAILELVVVRLVPELADSGVESLLAERLGDLDPS